jgi:hypothetical protein
VESDILHTERFCLLEIGGAGIAAVGRSLPRRRIMVRNVALQHRQEASRISRIARLDDDVVDQPTAASGEVELMAIVSITATFDDDVGVCLEQADQFLIRRHRLAGEHAALRLIDDAGDQRQIMLGLATQRHGLEAGMRH